MPAQGRLGDKARALHDAHGCLACPHTTIGPAISGSLDVNVNSRPALRVDDAGIHGACCGSNQWTASQGSATVFINGKSAHRVGDATTHCGSGGFLSEGSHNVFVGGPPTGAAALPGVATASSAPEHREAGTAAAAAMRRAMRDAAASGKGLVKRDCDHCDDDAFVSPRVDPAAIRANEEDDRAHG